MRNTVARNNIAIITSDVMGPIRNGGVGTACAHLATHLAREGHHVDLVYANCEPVSKKWRDFFAKKNVSLKSFENVAFDLQCASHWAGLSYLAYEYVKKNSYDLVIFPDMGGLGYFCQMAKKTGLDFKEIQFLIMFLGPLTWSKEDNDDLFRSSFELSIPMLERFSVENADVLQVATPWSNDWCKERGWKNPNPVELLFPFELPAANQVRNRTDGFDEIVFFGRLEPRKGLPEFLDAINKLKMDPQFRNKKVTLLGSFGDIDGLDIAEMIEEFTGEAGIRLKMITDKQSSEAIEYLKSGKRLAVIASRSETMGFTLIECLAHQIPFIASSIAPFRTLLGKDHPNLLFAPRSSESMIKALRNAMELGVGILDRDRAETLYRKTMAGWTSLINETLSRPTEPTPRSSDASSISVLIAHHNRASYLDEALESLMVQTTAPLEVIVYDDASTNKEFVDTIEKWKPSFKKRKISLKLIEGRENRGPSFARNELAKSALGDFVLFMDDDNRAHPTEIETLTRMQQTSAADVISIAMTKFIDGQENLWFERRWTPIGFDLNCAFFDNIFGDTNFLMRRSLFLSIGGFVDDPSLTAEDMNVLVKAALKGARMYVCPEPLFDYRVHPNNRSRVRSAHERRYHIEFMLNQLARRAEIEPLTPLAQLITSWNRKVGHPWLEEPPFWPKRLEKHSIRSTKLIEKLREQSTNSFSEFGCSWKVNLDRDRRLNVRWSLKNRPVAGFVDITFVAEHPGTLRCSNPAVRMKFTSGLSSFRIPINDLSSETFWISLTPLRQVFVIAFDLLTPKAISNKGKME